ncbi:MAG: hypothetical protein WCJ13_01910 [Coriobacteriia bacterium]
MQVSRERKGARALMPIEIDAEVDRTIAERIAEQHGVKSVRQAPAI